MNWRTPILDQVVKLSQPTVYDEFKLLKKIEFKSPQEIQKMHEHRLRALLLHAYENTDYYHDVLQDCSVVHNGTVNLDRFEDIPFLTKEIIREQKDRLVAKKLPKGRKMFTNSTGGSTGQPLEFQQDNIYWDINVATKLYHFWVLDKQPGDPELKIWESEHDLIKGSESLKARLMNWAYNRRTEQCFHLPQERIEAIVNQINTFKPKIIWSYRDGIDIIAKFINKNAISMHQPAAIFLGGGSIYPHIRDEVKKAFKAPVVDMYGSREMGDVGCQCSEEQGLHISMNSHKVEVVDLNDDSVVEQEGEIAITSLHNYALPFIRYKIGDRGKLLTQPCPCGRTFPIMSPVSGRNIEMLINSKGESVDAIYFIQLFGVYFPDNFVHRFQVVQEDYDLIHINIVLEPDIDPSVAGESPSFVDIKTNIQKVMGENCSVRFNFVDQIPLTKSGKHPYVISKVTLKVSV